ncbi:MAG: LptF/LptG family permease [Calditerrivibrio sp.]|uniref:LptF/LptG family permease n=1 Tax=Calditerrivibrio sp. TaxID=2792612 RepID=UPI003D12FBF2
MNKFQIYFLKILIRNFIVVEAFVYIIYMFFMFFTQSKYIARYGATFKDIFIYDVMRSPVFISQTLPVSFIVAVVVTFIILIRTTEITAYVSIGGSLLSILKVLVFLSIFVSVIMFFLTEFVVPKSQAKSNDYKIKYIEKREEVRVTTLNNFWIKDKNSFIQVGTIDTINKKLFDIKFIDLDENGKIVKVRYISQADYIEGKKWSILDYKDVDTTDVPKIVKEEKNFIQDNDFFTRLVDVSLVFQPKELTFSELKKIVKFYKSKGLSYSLHMCYYYNKIANILNVVLLVIVVLPFLIDLSRGFSYIRAAGNGIVIVFLYFIAQSTFFSMGKSGVMPPFWSNFLGYFIFISIGLFGYYRKRKLFYV